MSSAKTNRLISIVIPLHNEAANILPLYNALISVLDKLNYRAEIIFVDDGSKDDSLIKVKSLQRKDKRVLVVELVRNFGKEIALSAGLHATTGEAAIMIDADLQHPPKLIPQFIDKWEKGAEAVIGVRDGNNGQGWLKGFLSKLFYKMINRISETTIVPNATDFRLVDQIIIEEFNRFTERNRLTRGLIDWLGFKHDFIYFTAPDRYRGTVSYNFPKLVKLAVNGVVSHSLFPLRLASYLGVIIIATSGPFGIFIYVEKYILDDSLGLNFSGPAILAVLILFLVGVVLVCMGMIALYIASIYDEVINRPLYVVRQPRRRRAREPYV